MSGCRREVELFPFHIQAVGYAVCDQGGKCATENITDYQESCSTQVVSIVRYWTGLFCNKNINNVNLGL